MTLFWDDQVPRKTMLGVLVTLRTGIMLVKSAKYSSAADWLATVESPFG
jgi:di/tricarboxylate transporter